MLLLQHPPFAAVQTDELREVVGDLVTEGKLRAWGVSVSNADEAAGRIVWGAQVLCVPFHLLPPRLVWDIEAASARRTWACWRARPLCTACWRGASARQALRPDDQRAQRWSADALTERVEQLNELCFLQRGPVLTMAQGAQRFVLAHDVVSSVVLGARTPGQVDAFVWIARGSTRPLRRRPAAPPTCPRKILTVCGA